ncbi:unnamed protein product, partial [Ectocarpus sp. 12 AP-2014]
TDSRQYRNFLGHGIGYVLTDPCRNVTRPGLQVNRLSASEKSFLNKLLAKQNWLESGDSEEDVDEFLDDLEDARAEPHGKYDVVLVVKGSIADSIQTLRIPISP